MIVCPDDGILQASERCHNPVRPQGCLNYVPPRYWPSYPPAEIQKGASIRSTFTKQLKTSVLLCVHLPGHEFPLIVQNQHCVKGRKAMSLVYDLHWLDPMEGKWFFFFFLNAHIFVNICVTSLIAQWRYQSKAITSFYIDTMVSSRWDLPLLATLSLFMWQVPFQKSHIRPSHAVFLPRPLTMYANTGTSEYNYPLIFGLEEPWPFTIHALWQLFKELLLLIIRWDTDLTRFWNLHFSSPPISSCSTGSITEVIRIKQRFGRWL